MNLDTYVAVYEFVKDHAATMPLLTYDIELGDVDTSLSGS